ncbi:hypothetical protein, variant 2 [Phialophora macrospora]|uniref:Uncharacterized protein n=1 Tax=Phialophora macrospora TaxID=1851006 RepID=A0A0D2FFU9_9EURO|nr:hypothetical protein, variant 1 [Phialophora macrospora]KIW65685.1 hypothetical protein, variant 2 [Phialophora macrospora]
MFTTVCRLLQSIYEMAIMNANVSPFAVPAIFSGVVICSLFLKIFIQYLSLRHIPGPWPAKLTNFWLASKFWTGGNFLDIAIDLDRKYGPVVAYGPNRVLFSDPAAVGVIFNTKDALQKAESYEPAIPAVNGKLVVTIATERSESRISAIKKQIIHAFSTNAMLDYEPHIDRNIMYLMSRLGNVEMQGDQLNIAPWLIFFAFDTICRIAFSDDQGLMEKQADMGNSLEGARQRLAYWHTWQALPWMERLLFKNRWAVRLSARASNKGSMLGQLAAARLQDRLEKGGLGTYSDLLDRFLQAAERDPEVIANTTVHGLVISMIHAGAESTSATLLITLYYLMANPRTLVKLREELKSATLSSPPQWTEVHQLRYLEACIKEAGRLRPLVFNPMEREVPANGPGIQVAGVYIPPGTVVAVNTHALNREPTVWGEHPNEYRPERWIECNEAQLQRMERANLFFSAGRRVCIGQHVAWIEMKKVLPELLLRFDIEPADPYAPLKNAPGTMNLFIDELLVRLTPR